jgi:hypothetical protein
VWPHGFSCLWPWLIILTISISITACTSRYATEKVVKQLKTITSWAATTSLVGDAWLANAAPRDYTLRILQESQERLHEQFQILQSSSFSPATSKALYTSRQHLELTVAQMSAAVNHEDSAALAQHLCQLRADQETLVALLTQMTRKHE